MSTLSFGEKRCGTRKAEAPAQAAAGPVSVAMAERPARPHQGDTRTVSTSIETPKPNGMNLHVAQHSPNGTAAITRAEPEVTLRGVGGTQQHQLAPLGAVIPTTAVMHPRLNPGAMPHSQPAKRPESAMRSAACATGNLKCSEPAVFLCPMHRTAGTPARHFRLLEAKTP